MRDVKEVCNIGIMGKSPKQVPKWPGELSKCFQKK